VINAWAFLNYWGARARAAPPKSTPMGKIDAMQGKDVCTLLNVTISYVVYYGKQIKSPMLKPECFQIA